MSFFLSVPSLSTFSNNNNKSKTINQLKKDSSSSSDLHYMRRGANFSSLDDEDSSTMFNEDYEFNNDDIAMYSTDENNDNNDSLGEDELLSDRNQGDDDEEEEGKEIETNIDNELNKEKLRGIEMSKTSSTSSSAVGRSISVWCFDNSSQESNDMLLDINNDEKKIYEDLCYVTFSSTNLPEVIRYDFFKKMINRFLFTYLL